MRRTDARNAARDNFTALGNERVEQAGVLVVYVVDLLDTKPADLLAPEILLLGCDRFVAAGGPLRRADGTSTSLLSLFSLFRHAVTPSPRLARAAQEQDVLAVLRAWELLVTVLLESRRPAQWGNSAGQREVAAVARHASRGPFSSSPSSSAFHRSVR